MTLKRFSCIITLMPLQKFDVLDPPTGAAIEAKVLSALGESALLPLVLLNSEQQVPKASPQDVSFRIRQTGHPEDGGMVISGFTEPDRRHIIIRTTADSDRMASATIVTTD